VPGGPEIAMRAVAFGLFGLAFGSFLTVVVHRLPRREPLTGRSRCPRCGAVVRARDNVPVVSWLLLRGRCRTCKERISAEYPLTELATAALFVATGFMIDPLYPAILVAPFCGLMLAVALVDARFRIVPNRLIYPAFVVYAAAIAAGHLVGGGVSFLTGLVGLAAYAGPLLIIALIVPGGMGMGDVKLAAMIGLVLGSLGLPYVAVAAGVGVIGGGLGAVLAVALLGVGRRQHIPFGPFLAGGAVVAALAAHPITGLYLSLFGLG
jgi:leader peptidase (prepilin peptidase) / N-methyltransferase